MNAGEIVIAAIGAAGGIGGAVFAWVQAKAAVGSRNDANTAKADAEAAQKRAEEARDEALRLAREANDAFNRQAEALERNNELTEAAMRTPDWTIENTGTASPRAINTSHRTMLVQMVTVTPEDNTDWVEHVGRSDYPFRVEPQEAIRLKVMRGVGGNPARLAVVEWSFEGEEPRSELRVPLV